MKRLMALMALTTLMACDRSTRNDLRQERDDRLCRAAMDDYRAGRMEAAIAGFEKAIRNDPANASARFQLACLLQDVRRDFAGAYCSYREYLMQHPESDRARLAKDRLTDCEKGLANELAKKYGLNSAERLAKELDALRAELKTARDRIAADERNLGISQGRVRALSAERDRLVKAVKGVGGGDAPETFARPTVVQEKDLLEESDEDANASEDVSSEAARLMREEQDDLTAGSSLLPVQKPVQHPVAQPAPTAAKTPPKEADRPSSYVVQRGDSLSSIARRFYGSASRATLMRIRNANKERISMDLRINVGDTLVLP